MCASGCCELTHFQHAHFLYVTQLSAKCADLPPPETPYFSNSPKYAARRRTNYVRPRTCAPVQMRFRFATQRFYYNQSNHAELNADCCDSHRMILNALHFLLLVESLWLRSKVSHRCHQNNNGDKCLFFCQRIDHP